MRLSRRGMMSTPGLLWAHKYAQRALLSIPALYHRTAIVPWRPTSRLYSTTEEGAPPLIPIVHKRPPKDLQVARQVIDGVESTKDSVLKAYCLAKVRRSAPKRQHASKEPTTDASPYSSYDPDISKVIDFDQDMLSQFVAIKRKEGWSTSDCARAVEYIVYDWPLSRCVRFFGHFTRVYVELGEDEKGETVKNGKWTPKELGHLVGGSMTTREYAFMVDLLVKMVIGDGAHKTLLINIKDEHEGAYCFRGISRFYGVTLSYFTKWEFPFMGTVIRELSTVPPKYAKHYYPWFTNELGMNFSVDVLVDIAEQRRIAKGEVLLNPRLVDVIENWTQEEKDIYKGKLYAKMDGNDNALTYLLYKFARFLKIMKPKKKPNTL